MRACKMDARHFNGERMSQARIGKNGSLKWSDSISGTTASFSQEYLGDVNGDGVSDKSVGLRGERKPPALAVGIANPLE